MADQKALPEKMTQSKEATVHTQKANAAILSRLPLADRKSFKNAQRGFIATLDNLILIRESDHKTTFDLTNLKFLSEDAPDTVNPSLWRQAQLNTLYHGLFKVVEGIYQVRSFDLANMTLVRGKNGWLIIDPLTSAESSRAALDLANKHLGERPVIGVIYTHSHFDHFAGVLGVVDPEEVVSGKVKVVAPEYFVKEVLSENIMAGNAMQRRATYMYGQLLPHSPTGFVSDGLGVDLSQGTTGFIAPNDTITKTGEIRIIDGIEIVFQMTPETEAVSEFVFYFPQYKALCMSELTSHHLHNIYTPRGAQIRDALAWSDQINTSIDLFGEKLEVQFATHHWPTWGREAVIAYLETQRDLYKYIHDQTLRLANHGFTKEEIAEQLTLPDSLAGDFSCRDYYGTISHNSKAVYVKYLGYFDGNPAYLHPLPPIESAKHYVDYMGGTENIINKARQSFDRGEYRWVAEIMNHVVFAEPENVQARALLADTYEQLGYQAESGPWRNFYLSGAQELRFGIHEESAIQVSPGLVSGIPLENIFQILAVRLNGVKAAGKNLFINLILTDMEESYRMTIKNAVLNVFKNKQNPNANASLRLSSQDFKFMVLGLTKAMDLIGAGKFSLEGDASVLDEFAGLFDSFNLQFPIVTPRRIP